MWYDYDKDKGCCGIIMRQRSKSRSPSMALAKSWHSVVGETNGMPLRKAIRNKEEMMGQAKGQRVTRIF